MPRDLWWSYRGGCFLWTRYPCRFLITFSSKPTAWYHQPSRPTQIDDFRFEIPGGKPSDSDEFRVNLHRNMNSRNANLRTARELVVRHFYLTNDFLIVVLRKSIPTQIRRLILQSSNGKGQIDGFVRKSTSARRLWKHFVLDKVGTRLCRVHLERIHREYRFLWITLKPRVKWHTIYESCIRALLGTAADFYTAVANSCKVWSGFKSFACTAAGNADADPCTGVPLSSENAVL